MNLIQQAVERAKQMESEGKVVAPVTQTGPRPEARLATPATASGPRIGLASLPHIEPVAARGPLPLPLVLLVSLLALGGGALLYFFLAKSQSPESPMVVAVASPVVQVKPAEPAAPAAAVAAVATPAPAAAETAAAASTTVAAPATAQATAPAAPDAPAAVPMDDARNAVEGWARAWSERDVDAYLAYYGQGFRPDKGQSRKAWEASRRQAIGKRASISVVLRDMQFEAQGSDRIAVRFAQDYAADGYSETGTAKTLVLAREASGLRIVTEAAGSARIAAR